MYSNEIQRNNHKCLGSPGGGTATFPISLKRNCPTTTSLEPNSKKAKINANVSSYAKPKDSSVTIKGTAIGNEKVHKLSELDHATKKGTGSDRSTRAKEKSLEYKLDSSTPLPLARNSSSMDSQRCSTLPLGRKPVERPVLLTFVSSSTVVDANDNDALVVDENKAFGSDGKLKKVDTAIETANLKVNDRSENQVLPNKSLEAKKMDDNVQYESEKLVWRETENVDEEAADVKLVYDGDKENCVLNENIKNRNLVPIMQSEKYKVETGNKENLNSNKMVENEELELTSQPNHDVEAKSVAGKKSSSKGWRNCCLM